LWGESGITPHGKETSIKLGKYFKTLLPLNNVKIYNSPFLRTSQTAKFMFGNASTDKKWLAPPDCRNNLLEDISNYKEDGENIILVTHSSCIDNLRDHEGNKIVRFDVNNKNTYGLTVFISIDSSLKQVEGLGYLYPADWENVTDPAPSISSTPTITSLAFSLKPNDTRYIQAFNLWNSGGDEIHYSISSDSDWITCTPNAGSSAGEEDTIIVNYDTAGLSAGTHSAIITISDQEADNSPYQIPVTMAIGDYSPIYRFWSDQNMAYFYTISGTEQHYVSTTYPESIWRYETMAWFAHTEEDAPVEASPIYRFWSDQNMTHFYTISETEKNYVIATFSDEIWRYEGIAYYAYVFGDQPLEAKPVYRFWSDQNMTHFYTISETEKNYLIATFGDRVWKYEGIAWYAYATPTSD
jgi:hypothetical protein